MGGFFGSAQSMNTVMKNNRAMLGKRKSLFKSKKDYLSVETSSDADVFVDHQKASPILLENIKNRFQNKRKYQFKINLSIFTILLISVVFFGLYFFETHEEVIVKKKKMTNHMENPRVKNFLFFINDGDEWLNQGKFENALFQYKKAAELDPNNYAALYRICLSYAYLCRYDAKDCDKGKLIFDETLVKFPNQIQLQELSIFFLN